MITSTQRAGMLCTSLLCRRLSNPRHTCRKLWPSERSWSVTTPARLDSARARTAADLSEQRCSRTARQVAAGEACCTWGGVAPLALVAGVGTRICMQRSLAALPEPELPPVLGSRVTCNTNH